MRNVTLDLLRKRLPLVQWQRQPKLDLSPAITPPPTPPPPPARVTGQVLQTLDEDLGRVIKHLRYLREISVLAKEFLPANLRQHVQISVSLEDEWSVTASSPAVATHLRFLLNGLRDRLRRRLKRPIPTLELRVRPTRSSMMQAPPAPITTSPTNSPPPPSKRSAKIQNPRLQALLSNLQPTKT